MQLRKNRQNVLKNLDFVDSLHRFVCEVQALT